MTTLTEDMEVLHALRKTASELKAEADGAKADADRAEYELFQRMEQERCGSQRVDGIGNFVRAETEYAQVQDEAELLEWAEAEMPEIFEQKPRKKILNEIVRERLNSGEPLPPGLGFYSKQYVSLRSA